jgi:hypothetical protein
VSTYQVRESTDRSMGCDELGCVDIGVGIYHHPMCGLELDDDEMYGPMSPEDEEELLAHVPDPVRVS